MIKPLDYYWTPFDFQVPNLDFKILNSSDKTIFFTKAIISVAKSQPDSFPIIVVHTGYSLGFAIENIGWGKVYNCKIKFNLVNPYETSNFNNGYMFEMNLGDFSSYPEETDLSKYFETLGVNTKVVLNNYVSKTYSTDGKFYTIIDDEGKEKTINEQEYNERWMKALGPFQNSVAKMYGEISYEGINTSGKKMKEKIQFEDVINFEEKGCGMPAPPSSIYDLMLEGRKSNYTKEISISQAIKPNEFDRFNIQIAAPISSRHQFDITLFYNNNQKFTIPNISLNYFMSKADSSSITNDKSLEIKEDKIQKK